MPGTSLEGYRWLEPLLSATRILCRRCEIARCTSYGRVTLKAEPWAWAAAEGRDVAAARAIGKLFVQHQRSGEPQEISDELVTRLELGSEDLAQVYAFVGDGENALQALEIAFEERSGSRSVLSMKINPAYDFIRDEPRFVALLQKLGLSE